MKGFVKVIWILTVFFLVSSAFALEDHSPNEFAPANLPPDAKAEKPAPNVPSDVAAFFGPTGKWEGRAMRLGSGGQWSGPFFKICFEQITATQAKIIFAKGSVPSQNRQARTVRITATFSRSNGKIFLTFPPDWEGQEWVWSLEGSLLVGKGSWGRYARLKPLLN